MEIKHEINTEHEAEIPLLLESMPFQLLKHLSKTISQSLEFVWVPTGLHRAPDGFGEAQAGWPAGCKILIPQKYM